nr:carbohydrate-binding family 9-like protein [Bacteroidota bacterium]
MWRFFTFLLVFGSVSSWAQTQIENPKSYFCNHALSALLVDGNIDDLAWQDAEWSDKFLDIEGIRKPVPQLETRMKMLWDTNALYIAAELAEPQIWANITERDDIIYLDNDFEVFIDPDGDNHNYFELEVNAFGTEFDLFLSRPYHAGGKPLIGFDISGLQTAVAIDGTINNPQDKDIKWTIEIAIPWESMLMFAPGKRPPKPGDTWRMNFSRVQWTTEVIDGKYEKIINVNTGKPLAENNWVWSQQGAVNMHMPEMWGYVTFVDEPYLASGDFHDVDPYFSYKMLLVSLFYQQKWFFDDHGFYATSVDQLQLERGELKYEPVIEATGIHFLIQATTFDGTKIFIDQEKRIWTKTGQND